MPPKRGPSATASTAKRAKQDVSAQRQTFTQSTLFSSCASATSSSTSSTLSSSTKPPASPARPSSAAAATRYFKPTFGRVHSIYDSSSSAACPSFQLGALLSSDSPLRAAILCSANVDAPMLFTQLDKAAGANEDVPVLLIAREDDVRAQVEKKAKDGLWPYKERKNVKVKTVVDKTARNGRGGVFHPKFMLLRYDSHLRVVISTANLCKPEWSTQDNSVWVTDFPSASPASPSARFCSDLQNFLSWLGIPLSQFSWLGDFDFGETEGPDGVRLVWSIKGRYPLDSPKGGGLLLLPQALKSFGFAPGAALGGEGYWEIEAQNWLWHFLASASGLSPLTYSPDSPPKAKLTPSAVDPSKVLDSPLSGIKIGFPSWEEVKRAKSKVGENAGSPIWVNEELDQDADDFPRHLMHDQRSKREKVISHSKTLLALHKYYTPDDEEPKHEGWVYVGSHNFTSPAWGHLEKRSTIRMFVVPNFELGVVFPIRASSAEELEKKASDLMPYKRPVQPYGPDDRLFDKAEQTQKRANG
ncbi:hypothetical protein JCM10213v2_004145 [Rhodosporidiobolus nylandii]